MEPLPFVSLPYPGSAHDIRHIAVVGMVGPRTVDAAYRGRPVRSIEFARIVRAAHELGFAPPAVREPRG